MNRLKQRGKHGKSGGGNTSSRHRVRCTRTRRRVHGGACTGGRRCHGHVQLLGNGLDERAHLGLGHALGGGGAGGTVQRHCAASRGLGVRILARAERRIASSATVQSTRGVRGLARSTLKATRVH